LKLVFSTVETQTPLLSISLLSSSDQKANRCLPMIMWLLALS